MTMLSEVTGLVKGQFAWLKFASENTGPANAFIMDLPAKPDFAIAFYQYGGEAPEETMGGMWAENPRLQILVRHQYVEEAMDRAYDLWNFFGAKKHAQLAQGPVLLKITPNSSPFELGPDAAGLQRISMNFRVMKELG